MYLGIERVESLQGIETTCEFLDILDLDQFCGTVHESSDVHACR
jgi:hypothetical protein